MAMFSPKSSFTAKIMEVLQQQQYDNTVDTLGVLLHIIMFLFGLLLIFVGHCIMSDYLMHFGNSIRGAIQSLSWNWKPDQVLHITKSEKNHIFNCLIELASSLNGSTLLTILGGLNMVVAFVGGIAAHNENALIGEYVYVARSLHLGIIF